MTSISSSSVKAGLVPAWHRLGVALERDRCIFATKIGHLSEAKVHKLKSSPACSTPTTRPLAGYHYPSACGTSSLVFRWPSGPLEVIRTVWATLSGV